MIGFLRFTLLLLLLFGSQTVQVRADDSPLSPRDNPVSRLHDISPLHDSLISRATTLRLAIPAPSPINDSALMVPSTVSSQPAALTLYAGPATTFSMTASVPQGTELWVRSILANGAWVEVEGAGQRGWVPAELVLFDSGVARAYAP